MAGRLYVVATPIGHLDDITLRALRILREVSVVAAEDTRRTANLLKHYEIRSPLVSLHEHNERSRTPQLVRRMLDGDSVALVTDAGTPGISDPGAVLVAEARTAGLRVDAVPGPSAVMAALSVAGIPAASFKFAGFPPTRSKDRKLWFANLEAARQEIVVFFESPHRIASTVSELSVSVKQPIILARELTKANEEVRIGHPAELLAGLKSPKGEFTVIVPPLPPSEEAPVVLDIERLRAEIGLLTEIGGSKSRRQTAKRVAERLGLPTNQVYNAMKGLDGGQSK